MEIRGQPGFILKSVNVPSLKQFTAAVRVNGANFYNNTYSLTNVDINFTIITSSRERD